MTEFDIVGFFDNCNHHRLLREVAEVIDDTKVTGLVRRWLRAGVLTEAASKLVNVPGVHAKEERPLGAPPSELMNPARVRAVGSNA